MRIKAFNYHSNNLINRSLTPHDKELLAYWFAQHFDVDTHCFIVKVESTDAVFIFSLKYSIDYFIASNIAVFWSFYCRWCGINRAIFISLIIQLKLGSEGVSITLIFFMDFVVLWFRVVFSYFLRSAQFELL